MAAWQFDMLLVPAARLLAAAGGQERLLPAVAQETEWWEQHEFLPGYAHSLDAFLPRLSPLARGIDSWGEPDGNRVDVVHEAGRVAEIDVRVDAREINLDFLEYLVRFALQAKGTFITEEGEVVKPEVSALVSEVTNSRAHRFVVDPATYLESQADSDAEP